MTLKAGIDKLVMDINCDTNMGDHYLIDFTGCDPEKIGRLEVVKEIFYDAARKSNATIISDNYHQFEPVGVSGVILIAESHFTIHTWPEKFCAAVDIFTCGEEMNVEVAICEMKKNFSAKECRVKKIPRGVL